MSGFVRQVGAHLARWRDRAWVRILQLAGRKPRDKKYALAFVEGDELPAVLPDGVLVVAREDGELWSAGMICPCGCGRPLEVMLLDNVKPRWSLSVDRFGQPTLHPSVWARDGCRSHFWLVGGKVRWCRDLDEDDTPQRRSSRRRGFGI